MLKKKQENRITNTLMKLKKRNEKALVCFLTAGFPKLNSTVSLVQAMEDGGADIIEIGMPFSDPLAEGPVIQHSSQKALRNGVTLESILADVREIRKRSDIPLILMGYLNPILAFGAERFFSAAAKAGVDGFILPELPLEESSRFRLAMKTNGLANIILVAPTTPSHRVAEIDQMSDGFLYCVSTTGVTGSISISNPANHIRKVKASAKKNPVLVGFGIKTPDDVRHMAPLADGVIVGSGLVQVIRKGKSLKQVEAYVRQLKEAL